MKATRLVVDVDNQLVWSRRIQPPHSGTLTPNPPATLQNRSVYSGVMFIQPTSFHCTAVPCPAVPGSQVLGTKTSLSSSSSSLPLPSTSTSLFPSCTVTSCHAVSGSEVPGSQTSRLSLLASQLTPLSPLTQRAVMPSHTASSLTDLDNKTTSAVTSPRFFTPPPSPLFFTPPSSPVV